MRKVLIVFISLIAIFLLSCEKQAKEDIYYTFNYEDAYGGELVGPLTQNVKEGESGAMVEAIPDYCYDFVSWSDGIKDNPRFDVGEKDISVYPIYEKVVFEYPLISIETKDHQKLTSKETYVSCTVSVTSNEHQEYEIDNVEAKIRGRGNSTWGMPKKPYKLKFSEKQDFLGMGSAKEFTLIANYCDKSLIRNYLAYKIGALIGVRYTTEVRFVEVVLNGEYVGLYLVCEQNEVKTNRVELDTKKDDSYFIELDSRAKEDGLELDKEYFVIDNKMYVIKHPDTEEEDFTKEKCKEIKDFFLNAYNIVKGDDYSKICEVIDVENFALSYIVYELFNNVDVGFASWYLYRDSGGKIGNGPLWDFDISCGNVDYNDDCKKYNNLYAKKANPWFNNLLKHEEFQALVKEKLELYREEISEEILVDVSECMDYRDSFNRNFEKWDIMGVYVWPNPRTIVNLTTWDDQVDYLVKWLLNSLNYMCEKYEVNK